MVGRGGQKTRILQVNFFKLLLRGTNMMFISQFPDSCILAVKMLNVTIYQELTTYHISID